MEDLPFGRTAALVPEFAVEDRTCPWAEHSDDDDDDDIYMVISKVMHTLAVPRTG